MSVILETIMAAVSSITPRVRITSGRRVSPDVRWPGSRGMTRRIWEFKPRK